MKNLEGASGRLRCGRIQQRQGAHRQAIGVEVLRSNAGCTVNLRVTNARAQGAKNARNNSILPLQWLIAFDFEAVAPGMVSCGSIDDTKYEPHSCALTPDLAVQKVNTDKSGVGKEVV